MDPAPLPQPLRKPPRGNTAGRVPHIWEGSLKLGHSHQIAANAQAGFLRGLSSKMTRWSNDQMTKHHLALDTQLVRAYLLVQLTVHRFAMLNSTKQREFERTLEPHVKPTKG